MTDKEKLDKLVAEIERLYHQSLVDENRQAELGLSSAACTSYGKSKACKELLSFTDSMQKEPKECMYSKGNYTDEDRKVLCDGCKEECKFNKKEYSVNNGLDLGCGVIWKDEEPVSEDLEKAAEMFIDTLIPIEVDTVTPFAAEYVIGLLNKAIEFGANWQKQQMISKAIDGHVGQTINGMLRALSDETFGDMGFTAGEKVKLIIIKED